MPKAKIRKSINANMIDFKSQRALITGASGTIGGQIARTLHDLGAHVVISGSNQQKLQDLAEALREVTVIPCDLSDEQSVQGLVQQAGDIDILVCNAGITKDDLSIRMQRADFTDVLNLNLVSTFVLNKEAIRLMMRKRYGRIINISSVVGVSGNPGQANYCASKAGLIGMSKALAQEVAARSITVNCIAPGFIESNMTQKLTQAQREHIMQRIPMRAFGSAQDVADAVAFLASRNAGYITGQTLHINGGMLMV